MAACPRYQTAVDACYISRMVKSPMMQQYEDAKKACGDALLFFRMGDFYELFHEDAKVAAKEVGLTLTSRDKNTDNPIPMAGFPHHQLEGYLGKLIKMGHRVAICEQVEDPKKAKGLVKREVTRVVTPGTLTDDGLLDPKENNFLAAICNGHASKTDPMVGMAWVELSTGRFQATSFPRSKAVDELLRVAPAECLIPAESDMLPDYVSQETLITTRPPFAFSLDTCQSKLSEHFGTKGLQGFGFGEADSPAIQAAGAVLDYLQETQKTSLDHIESISPYRTGSCLEIDEATRRSLELTKTLRDGRREASLLGIMDRTVTPMGSRMLADWLANPLTDAVAIGGRLDAVEELVGELTLCADVRDELKQIYDMERLLARVTTGRASPRDLSFIGQTLGRLPKIKARLAARKSGMLQQLETDVDLCPELAHRLETALVEQCPLSSRDGQFIREGFHAQLDELRSLAAGGKQWIAAYQAKQMEESGIPSLKIGYNKVFGYYLEVTNAHKDKIPATFIRKQTLKNAERYITPELKEYEEKVLSADDKAKELEYEIFCELRDFVQQHARRLQATSRVLAQVDTLLSLAELARRQAYCKPEIVEAATLEIEDGRHPVLDVIEPEGTFVPNDIHVGNEQGTVILITGPNMAGKSTYIRQVALLTLMAQMGSFVPAKRARIGLADRIFARVGASDELSRGHSTFMVEMTETARILNNATERSLVILDEIGRGTSTYDGLSLAWAIVEHMHDDIGCRTFFATHYHELTDLASTLDQVRNLSVSVKEWKDKVVFLHKLVDGAADKSYGIHVARLAGIPREVNERAKEVLSQLEHEHLAGDGKPKIATRAKRKGVGELQLTLFGAADHPLLDEIRGCDINQISPLDAFGLIQTWKEKLDDE